MLLTVVGGVQNKFVFCVGKLHTVKEMKENVKVCMKEKLLQWQRRTKNGQDVQNVGLCWKELMDVIT